MMWHSFSYVVTASTSSMTVAINTAVASPDLQVAVDDVILEQVRTIASGGSSPESSVKNQGVFLAEWSVLQTSWHFSDDVSPIVDYQWALGTSQGGVQLQGFRSVGRRQHASVSGLSLIHGTSLHVTVLARNAAGMTSVLHGDPMTVDMTPPDIWELKDGTTGEDVDFQTSTVIGARWTVNDSESSVGNCQWAIGTLPGKGDVQAFQSATASGSYSFSVSSDVASAISSLPLPTVLYVTVRCYNRAGLPARAVTDGVTIVASSQNQQMPTLKVLPDSLTQYPVRDTCHVYTDRLRMRWGSVTSQIPLSGFQIVRNTAAGQNSSMTPSLPFLLEAADLNLTAVMLTSVSSYDVSVNPVDIFGTITSGATHTTEVLPLAPVVNVNNTVTSSVSGSDLTLSWPNLFTSALTLNYEVTAGSVPGGGDITLFQQTQNTDVVISLANSRVSSFNMSVVVTAIDPCGQFATHTQNVNVVV